MKTPKQLGHTNDPWAQSFDDYPKLAKKIGLRLVAIGLASAFAYFYLAWLDKVI